MDLTIHAFGKSDTGLIRKNNEDSFAVDIQAGFCTVADGMGGAAAGEIASSIFVETAAEIFSKHGSFSEELRVGHMQQAFITANQRILDHIKSNPDHAGMGCTAELLAITDEGFVLGHMGDSRTYRLRNGQLKLLTKDHSLVQDQLDQGIITPEQAAKHLQRNVILRAVGTTQNPSLDLVRGRTYPGDLFLLCSDGLTDMVSDETILQALRQYPRLPEAADVLIALAKDGGGKDNVTVVLMHIES
ncbi:MAG TPA: Stp1/IreP family PP2C-type Ser/Thr phosphatase [Deltaproteobacteria bacterium]|nr:Stp1/IreP family PP2C-type Ser/Thr phosphatase [Deltaproteobacteria bacterium]HPJ92369.1 Stp1/IreP family PP2C-type Ser/Thr phosphatase [Deltaproteobacteria bacterium]